MTEVRVIGHRLLVLHFDDVSCAITASDLVAIDHDGASARIAIDGPLRDLSDYLDASSSAPPMRLIIDAAGCRQAFRACARLELIETSSLYRMPRVLRDCGCASWLRGIALLDDSSRDGEDADRKRPALWLDLARLADACDGTEGNQKEMLR
jgi:hypothetical protein